MRSFGSDNHSGIHPDILQAITEANENHAIAYGDDPWTGKLKDEIKKYFGNQAEIFLTFNGTGANVTALRCAILPFHQILAAETAHIVVDECGAPVLNTGASIQDIQTVDGKLTPEILYPFLENIGFEHHSQPKIIYISQCTELGTVYRPDEISALARFAHQHGMYLHVDGARLANACSFLNVSFKELITDTEVDLISFGGTKNGMMMGEAVISLRTELSENLKYIRKQNAQLYSKMRYASAQFLAYLKDDLWLRNATNANNMALRLREGIREISAFLFTQPTEANILLLKVPEQIQKALMEKHFFYVWNKKEEEIRLVTSWDTNETDIDSFLSDLYEITRKNQL